MAWFLSKYWFIFLLGLQNALVYRWNLLIRASFSLMSLAVAAIMWLAAFHGQTHIGGYNAAQTITYFISILFFNFAVSASNEDYLIATDIRMGTINQFLLKPINYLGYRIITFYATRLISVFAVIIPLCVGVFLLSDYLYFSPDPWRWGLVLVAGAMAAMIQFFIAYCFGLMAFWFLEIHGLVIFSLAVETFLSGQFFPLDLLPEPLFRISQYLPFYYQLYFPVAIFSGRIEFAAALHGLVIQALWVIALYAVSQLIWNKGIREHTAVGG